MKTVVDPTLKREASEFRLRYRCHDCAHFDDATGACAEGFPNAGHRGDSIETSGEIVFCKSFELF